MAQRAHGAVPLSTSGVLGSPPWLFEKRARNQEAERQQGRRQQPEGATTAQHQNRPQSSPGTTRDQPRASVASRQPVPKSGKHLATAQAGPDRALVPARVQPPGGQSLPGRRCTVSHCANSTLGSGVRGGGLSCRSRARFRLRLGLVGRELRTMVRRSGSGAEQKAKRPGLTRCWRCN